MTAGTPNPVTIDLAMKLGMSCGLLNSFTKLSNERHGEQLELRRDHTVLEIKTEQLGQGLQTVIIYYIYI